jgi:hypothetical protein
MDMGVFGGTRSGKRNRSIQRKPAPVPLPSKNPEGPDMWSNPSHRDGNLDTNRLSYGTKRRLWSSIMSSYRFGGTSWESVPVFALNIRRVYTHRSQKRRKLGWDSNRYLKYTRPVKLLPPPGAVSGLYLQECFTISLINKDQCLTNTVFWFMSPYCSGRCFPTFRRNVLPPEYGDRTYFRNIDTRRHIPEDSNIQGLVYSQTSVHELNSFLKVVRIPKLFSP